MDKHGGGYAQIKVKPWVRNNQIIGIEIVISDTGPGIADVDLALTDGYSTSNSLGLGLGAIRRLADEFEIKSQTREKTNNKSGTTIYFRKQINSHQSKSIKFNQLQNKRYTKKKWIIAGKTLARQGSHLNGDGFTWIEKEDFILIAVIDGLGHGYNAHLAAKLSIQFINKNYYFTPIRLMEQLHKELSKTVGAQVMIMKINKIESCAEYVSVGNIRGFHIRRHNALSLLTKDGIVGRHLPNLQSQTFFLTETSSIIIHTDGISRAWLSRVKTVNIYRYGAHNLVNDLIKLYRKKADDCTVVIIQND